jgi:hypothetical protein
MNIWNRFANWLIPVFVENNGETNMYATIKDLGNDSYALVVRNTGATVEIYGRARDARRGATRRGFVVA